MTQKKKTMSREDAIELYNDLQKSMTAIMQGNAPAKAVKPKSSFFKAAANAYLGKIQKPKMPIAPTSEVPFNQTQSNTKDRGVIAGVTFLMFCAFLKLAVGVVDYIGVFTPEVASASLVATDARMPNLPRTSPATPNNGLTTEDIKILSMLDAKRVALQENSEKLDMREQEISKKDKEFVIKLAEIRELTEQLRVERDKDSRKDQMQLDQLANVYGAMAPQESAKLIEQLDVTIALPLLKRMPEKRMGQILPMMSPEKALIITRLLSGHSAK